MFRASVSLGETVWMIVRAQRAEPCHCFPARYRRLSAPVFSSDSPESAVASPLHSSVLQRFLELVCTEQPSAFLVLEPFQADFPSFAAPWLPFLVFSLPFLAQMSSLFFAPPWAG